MKTTHFWGPALNFGFVFQGLIEWRRPVENVSRNMTIILCFYSMLGMRFGQKVLPTNKLLCCMHLCNFCIQSYHLSRRLTYQYRLYKDPQYKEPRPAIKEQLKEKDQ